MTTAFRIGPIPSGIDTEELKQKLIDLQTNAGVGITAIAVGIVDDCVIMKFVNAEYRMDADTAIMTGQLLIESGNALKESGANG